MSILLKNALLLTMDGDQSPLRGHDVLIDNGEIVKVARQIHARAGSVRERHDCTGKIVMPGLVNAHSHLTEILQKSFRDNHRMEIWREYRSRTEERARLTPRQIEFAATLACGEMLKSGVTSVLDHFSTRPELTPMRMKAIVSAFENTGIRGVLAPSLRDQNAMRMLGVYPRSKTASTSNPKRDQNWRKDILKILQHIKPYRGRIGVVLGPTSPLNCSDPLLREVVEMAETHDLGIHTHLLETRLQVWAGRRLYKKGLGERLRRLGLLSRRLSAAHCIWLEDRDIDLMAESGASAVHNPASNLKLGSGVAPIVRLRQRGVNVALGTDGGDTSDSYSIFDQMRLAAYLSRLTAEDSDQWVTALDALRMGTVNGSLAVPNWRGKIGKIKPGYRADLLILTPHLRLRPLTDVVHQLVFCEGGHSVDTVIVDGEVVLRNGCLTRVDEKRISDEVEAISRRMAKIYLSVKKDRSVSAAVRRVRYLYERVKRHGKQSLPPLNLFQ